MKIVIDIEDNNYEYIKNSHITYDIKLLSKQSKKDIEGTLAILDMIDTIKNGTPLPKGHGELVYREDVCNELRYMDNNGFITRSVNHVIEDIKKGVPTIIDADISGKENER